MDGDAIHETQKIQRINTKNVTRTHSEDGCNQTHRFLNCKPKDFT